MSVQQAAVAAVTLRDLAIIVFRRWRALACVFLGAVAAALFYVLVIQEAFYESEARLLIRLGQESGPPPTMMLDRQVVVTRSPSDVNSELDILRSRELFTAVVDRLDLSALVAPPARPDGFVRRLKFEIKAAVRAVRSVINDALISVGLRERLSPTDELVAILTGAIAVTVQPNSNVVVATLRWPWREGASAVLQHYIAAYQELRQRAAAGASSVRFFEELRAESRRRLAVADSELGAFESANGIQLLDEQKMALLRQLSEVEIRLSQATADRDIAELRVKAVERARGSDGLGVGAFETGSVGQMLVLDIAKLRAERDALAAREAGGSGLKRLQSEIESMLTSLSGHVQAALREKQEALALATARRDALTAELQRLHGTEVRWRLLRREARSAEENNQFHERKLEEARAVAALDAARIANVAVVQPPTEPTSAAVQRRGLLLGLAAVAGLLAGIAWIGLLEFLDHRIHTVDELARYLRAPVLGAIPQSARIGRFG
ncbi:MAG: hypothetical protein JNK67_27240 [Alphaproteobacteria bacterium]|nr:hypothetical protein [Alphaproteobacteria bacterium]